MTDQPAGQQPSADCGCDVTKGILCDDHDPMMQGAKRSLMQPSAEAAHRCDMCDKEFTIIETSRMYREWRDSYKEPYTAESLAQAAWNAAATPSPEWMHRLANEINRTARENFDAGAAAAPVVASEREGFNKLLTHYRELVKRGCPESADRGTHILFEAYGTFLRQLEMVSDQ